MLVWPIKYSIRTSTAQFERWLWSFRAKLAALPPEDIARIVESVRREVNSDTARGEWSHEEWASIEILLEDEPEPQILGKTLNAAFTRLRGHWNTIQLSSLDGAKFDRTDETYSLHQESFRELVKVKRTAKGYTIARPAGYRYRCPPPTAEVIAIFLGLAARQECYYITLDGLRLRAPGAPFRDVMDARNWVPSEEVRNGRHQRFADMQKIWFFHQLGHIDFRYNIWLPDRSVHGLTMPPPSPSDPDDGFPGQRYLALGWVRMVDRILVEQWAAEQARVWALRPNLFRVLVLSAAVARIVEAVQVVVFGLLLFVLLGFFLHACGWLVGKFW